MKKTVITGANSFIGYRLCQILAQNGYYVYAVIRKDNKNNLFLSQYENIKLIYCEMKDYSELDKIINEAVDVGITLAWTGTRGIDRNNIKMQEDNKKYSLQCVDALARLGCKKILTAGSQAEYGPWFKARKVTEDDICHPNTEYGKNKLDFYNKASEYCRNNSIILIEPRFFSLYGDDDNEKTMIVSMIRNMLQNKPCDLTQGIQLWDFLYVDDAIDGLYKLIESPNAEGVYNFGSGISKPLKEYILEMAKITKTKSELNFGIVSYPETGIVNTNPSIDKLRKDTDWIPTINFSEGIKKVIRKQQATI